ncbi:MAG: hypothetical protein OXH83_08210 [Bryobacterales bacterium]|nr:hypothetical protein [Bryobacterales bacterium]
MKQVMRTIPAIAMFAGLALGETADPAVEAEAGPQAQAETATPGFVVPAGTRVPLVMINSISSKHSEAGDPVYLESVYPVVVDGRIMIPAGTNVSGTVIHSRRPGRVKGRGQLGIRLEQMILPNGVIRDLSGRPSALDGRSPDNFDRETGTVKSPGTKGEDAGDIANTTATGASIGTIAGAIGGRTGTGLGIGSAAGAAAGLAKVLLTRGADAMLDRGTHIEMLLEQDLRFTEDELQGLDSVTGSRPNIGPGPDPRRNDRNNRGRIGRGVPIGIGRLPL